MLYIEGDGGSFTTVITVASARLGRFGSEKRGKEGMAKWTREGVEGVRMVGSAVWAEK